MSFSNMLFFAFVAFFAFGTPSVHAENPVDANSLYLAAVDRAMAMPDETDWPKLRTLYAETTFFKEAGPLRVTQIISRAAGKLADDGTAENAKNFRDLYRQHFAVINVQRIARDLHFKGKADFIDAARAEKAEKNLLAALLSTGDGKSRETAIQITTGGEAEAVVYALLDAPAAPQGSLHGGLFYTVYTGKDKKTGTATSYILAMPAASLASNMTAPPADDGKNRDAEDAAYLALVDAARANPDAADFQAIRFAYAQTSFYHPYGGERLWVELDNAGKAAQADKAALPAYLDLVRKNFGHFRSHVHAASMYEANADTFAALAPHKPFLYALVDSILKNGDGKTPETAFQIIDIKEEYFLMRSVLRVQMRQKRPTLQKNGHVYDVFEITDPQSGAESVLYFNVDRIFARPM